MKTEEEILAKHKENYKIFLANHLENYETFNLYYNILMVLLVIFSLNLLLAVIIQIL